jgi:hypothetical protein
MARFNHIKLTIIFILISSFLMGGQLFAFKKVGVTSFQFLKVMPGARSTALGEAYSSLAKGADAMFWNPAMLTQQDRFSAVISDVDWFLDTGQRSFSASYSYNGIWALGIMGMYADYGEIEVTAVEQLKPLADGYNPGLTGEIINPGANVLGIGFARMLTNKFSFGITAKYATENMDVKQKSVLMFDGGIFYNTGWRSIKLAATVRHFGPEVEYYDKSYPLPQTMNIGISAFFISPENNLFLSTTNQSVLFSFDIVQPRDYDQQYNFGMEYAFADLFFFRGGYKVNYDTAGLCLGFGVKYKIIKVDYSYNDYGDYLGDINRFSVGFEF